MSRVFRQNELEEELESFEQSYYAEMETLKWTDGKVMDFARISCAGAYGDYEGCNTMDKKLEKFKELHKRQDRFKEVYKADPDVEQLSGTEYRERCRDRWIVNRREIVMHSLIICQTAMIGLGEAMEALGHPVDDCAELAMALDSLIEEYKLL